MGVVQRFAAASLAALLAHTPASEALAAPDAVAFGGDLRTGVLGSESRQRDGSRSRDDELRARARAFVQWESTDGWRARARVAGVLSSGQDGLQWRLDRAAPTSSGLAAGQATLDEAWVQRSVGAWQVRAGRFQSGFNLLGVAGKSLDRNNSSNMSVQWTDGLHVQRRGEGGWRLHAILERNEAAGPSSTRRAPLDLGPSGARHSLFLGLEADRARGPLVQRMLSVSWLPEALPGDGAVSQRRDYLAVTARTALAWPVGGEGARWLFGGELGHAPNAPAGASGRAWQASITLDQFSPGHAVGLVAGEADAGWLLSTDYRPADRLLELRYQWRLSRAWSIEARLRQRRETAAPASATRRREDTDAYLRLSGRFGAR